MEEVGASLEAIPSPAPRQKLTFTYDYQGRRITKRVFAWNEANSFWEPSKSLAFVYDGWNLVSGITNPTSQIEQTRCYVWGLDLSNSIQGAGGVGGLLAAYAPSSVVGSPSSVAFAAFDANGNVSEYLDASGATAAHFEYSPFGQTIRSDISNPEIADQPFRFSTKYTDSETDLLYYGLRYYNSDTGQWLSKDPIGEDGGINLDAFLGNAPANNVDPLGLDLYAFDGTGQTYSGGSHIVILHDLYNGIKEYERGVGTYWSGPLDNPWVGGFTGAGGKDRLTEMYKKFTANYKSGDKEIDIIGFSRGAALAREFANILNDRGYEEEVELHFWNGSRREISHCPVEIRFVGLFDTVGSFGVPGNAINFGIRMDLPKNVKNAAQALAKDEKRALFPVTRLNPALAGQVFDEKVFRGDHSDIGGGWVNEGKQNELAREPLEYIHKRGIMAGVPFRPLPVRDLIPSWKPNDNRGFKFTVATFMIYQFTKSPTLDRKL